MERSAPNVATGHDAHPLIVVVDPVPETRHLLQSIFEEVFDAFVTLLSDSGRLLTIAHEARAALIVIELDARHPGDREQLRLLRADRVGATIPVFGLTAWGQDLGCEDARALGCDDCLAKPFDLHELIDKVAALLGRATPGTGGQKST